MNLTGDSDSSDSEVEKLKTFMTATAHDRSRAAPFYNELAPGFRARARYLAPPYTASRAKSDAGDNSERAFDDSAAVLSGMDTASRKDRTSSRMGRSRSAKDSLRQGVKLDLEDEQSRADRSGSDGTRDVNSNRREGDDNDSQGENSESKVSGERNRRHSRQASGRTVLHLSLIHI